jgi:hypothetical protein
MSDEKSPSERQDPLLLKLKDHVVQIETFLVVIIFALVILQLTAILAQSGQLRIPIWLIGPALLAGMKPLMRVNNPTGPMKNAVVWASTLGGWAGAIGGAAADIGTGGLTAGQGTLIGIAAGTTIGAAVGNWIESWTHRGDLLERGAAFDYLYSHRRRCTKVANAAQVEQALTAMPSFDKNQDGRKWYSYDDLRAFVKKC